MQPRRGPKNLGRLGAAWGVAGGLFALFSPNVGLTLAAVALVPFLFRLLWREGEPPVLLFALGIQWLQATMAIFHANILGLPVSGMYPLSDAEAATWYSMAGLVALGVGIRVAIGSLPPVDAVRLRRESRTLSIRRVFYVYLGAFAFGTLAERTIFAVPQLTQILLPLMDLHFVVLFLLAFLVIQRRVMYGFLLIAIVLEVASGFGGYFSGFKEVFYLLLIAIAVAHRRITKEEVVSGLLIIGVSLALSLYWTAIKTDYRTFLNQRTGHQVVLVPLEERFSWLIDRADRLEEDWVGPAAEDLAARIAYVEYFGIVINRVPFMFPHEDGALWLAPLKHILMPRVLFPDKARLPSDSELTSKYTGLRLASEKQGTSISMGYMAEAYIDFGFPLMLLPIFVLGIVWGAMYRYFLGSGQSLLVGYALAVVLLLGVQQYEVHNVKLVGGMVMNFLVFALLARFGSRTMFSLLGRAQPRYP